MPIYNYSCHDCGQEVQDKMVKSWDTEVLCPVCNEIMVKLPSCGSFTIDPAVPRGM